MLILLNGSGFKSEIISLGPPLLSLAPPRSYRTHHIKNNLNFTQMWLDLDVIIQYESRLTLINLNEQYFTNLLALITKINRNNPG